MTFADNPAYKPVVTAADGTVYYMPEDVTSYHLSRRVAAGAQDIFSASGATKELLGALVKQMLEMCNSDKPAATFRTDIGTLCNNLLYRMQYPVDEHCAIRMGSIYVFAEGEDPDKLEDFWTQRKTAHALNDPVLYSFFLTLGIELTPSWADLKDTLTDTAFLQSRRDALQGLTLPLSPT